MKKILFFPFVLCLVVMVNAQIIIDNSDMPVPGDTIRTSSSISLGTINYEETGANFTWDFSSLFPFSQTVDTFVSIQETPFIYQLVFTSSSNLAQRLGEFDQFPGFEVTDPYYYFRNSSTDYREVGFGVTLNGIPIPNKYNDPDLIYQFPLQVGNVDSSLANYEFDIPGMGYFGGWKKRLNTADGWGTLTTPFGTFETIRLKSEVYQYDSLYIDSLGFGFPVYREYVEYKWLGEDFGIPLCTVTDDGLLPTISYIDSVRNLITGVKHQVYSEDIKVFPNPSSDQVVVSFEGPQVNYIRVVMMNLKGETILSIMAVPRQNSISINFTDYDIKSGLYLMRIGLDNMFFTKKLMIR